MSPVIINDATEEIYVFVEIHMSECVASSLPESENSRLYTFDANEEWILVESNNETVVYAYGCARNDRIAIGREYKRSDNSDDNEINHECRICSY